MNPLELYLNRVARELRSMPSAKRDEELRELRLHLEQRVEDFESQELSIEEAHKRAIEGFGSPRVLGSKLCDAWEGIPFSWWRVIAAVLGVTVIWMLGNAWLQSVVMEHFWSWPESVLFPELGWLFLFSYASLPFGCGMLLSFWLGKRAQWIGLVYFTLMCLIFGLSLAFIPQLFNLSGTFNPLIYSLLSSMLLMPYSASYSSLVIGISGTFIGCKRRTRHLLSTPSGTTLSIASTICFGLRFDKRRLLTACCLAAILAIAIWTRVSFVLHPATPSQALRNALRLESYNQAAAIYEPPSLLKLRELPEQSLAERAGRERRVWFRAGSRLARWFAKDRLPYWERQYKSHPSREAGAMLRLARVNSHIEEGVVRVVNTPSGWRVEEGDLKRTHLWSWFPLR